MRSARGEGKGKGEGSDVEGREPHPLAGEGTGEGGEGEGEWELEGGAPIVIKVDHSPGNRSLHAALRCLVATKIASSLVRVLPVARKGRVGAAHLDSRTR